MDDKVAGMQTSLSMKWAKLIGAKQLLLETLSVRLSVMNIVMQTSSKQLVLFAFDSAGEGGEGY